MTTQYGTITYIIDGIPPIAFVKRCYQRTSGAYAGVWFYKDEPAIIAGRLAAVAKYKQEGLSQKHAWWKAFADFPQEQVEEPERIVPDN